jgi:Na+-translocating ferredoxin:NAD+ oxidoreductase RnfD subunit
MLILRSVKNQLILYLVSFAVFLAVKDKDILFLAALIIAVISAAALESIILYLKTKAFQVTASSLITGLIVGYVLSSDEAGWKIIAASIFAILSKHLIRVRGRHIFNPAACGIFLAIVFLGVYTQWRGTFLWYILLPGGLYFSYKIKKIEVIAGYAIVALALFGAQAFFQKAPLWNIFGYLSYFYIFIMVVEPKTTPIKKMGKFIFGAGVAVLIFILTGWGVKFDVELFSLLAMNAAVPLANSLFLKKEA